MSSTPEASTLTEAILGKELLASKSLDKIRAWAPELRAALVATLLGSILYLPYLGAVGLWDPWETHYGEVAREMIQRHDYVHPYWENAWFFSKPAFTMWMMAIGMQAADMGPLLALVLAALFGGLGWALYNGKLKGASTVKEFWGVLGMGAGAFFLTLFVWSRITTLPWRFSSVAEGPDALPLFTEWGFRLPFASFSILALALLAYALTITVNMRAALAAVFTLATMPLYFLLSRQAVTDTPIVSATICGLSCTMVGLFDRETKYRSEWWYAAYIFFAIATLAKGLLGFGVPMVVFGLYVLLRVVEKPGAQFSWLVKHFTQPFLTGLAAALVAGGIAYALGKKWDTTFMAVPVIDNKSLISAPTWLGIMWGSLAFWAAATWQLSRSKAATATEPPEFIKLTYDMRLGTGILLFLAVCLPWYYEMFTFWRVDDESKIFWFRFIIHDHFARLGSGVHTTTPGGDFTYFILQGGYAMFPWVLILPGAFAAAARMKIRGPSAADGVALLSVLWFVVTWALIGSSATKFHHYVFPMLPPLAILMGIFLDRVWEEGLDEWLLVLLFGVPLFLLVAKDLSTTPKDFTDLFVYNYDRPYPTQLLDRVVLGSYTGKQVLYGFMLLGFGVTGGFALMRNRNMTFTAGLAGALAFALWFNWSHWVDLSHHWTQRDQFWRYFTQRRPDEPIAAFLMNWRGETFYSRNTVKQIKDGNPQELMRQYGNLPGRKWSLVEHNRLGILKNAVGGDKTVTLIDKDLNNKFVLVTIE